VKLSLPICHLLPLYDFHLPLAHFFLLVVRLWLLLARFHLMMELRQQMEPRVQLSIDGTSCRETERAFWF
jgi:hypothetical protein